MVLSSFQFLYGGWALNRELWSIYLSKYENFAFGRKLDCEQSLFGQSRPKLGRTGESELTERGTGESTFPPFPLSPQIPLGFSSPRTCAFLAPVNSLSPVLPSLDVTGRRGTARSLVESDQYGFYNRPEKPAPPPQQTVSHIAKKDILFFFSSVFLWKVKTRQWT